MLYEIRLKTTHEYTDSASGGRHLLRLMPADRTAEAQRLIAGALDITPAPKERSDGYDFFGNRTTELVFGDTHDVLEFAVRARVERFATAPEADRSPPLPQLGREILAQRSLAADAPHHFVGASALVRPSLPIRDFVLALVQPDMTVFAAASAINLGLHGEMSYDGDATTVDTPLEEAFALRKGVCQDFAHVMIACLREIGIPAGYVSGFLRTEPPKGKPRLEGADAMHAWVQAWCGVEMGWVEFDPTNALVVGQDHVVVARGRDYADVAPVKGVLWTSGGQETEQAVDVVPLG